MLNQYSFVFTRVESGDWGWIVSECCYDALSKYIPIKEYTIPQLPNNNNDPAKYLILLGRRYSGNNTYHGSADLIDELNQLGLRFRLRKVQHTDYFKNEQETILRYPKAFILEFDDRHDDFNIDDDFYFM